MKKSMRHLELRSLAWFSSLFFVNISTHLMLSYVGQSNQEVSCEEHSGAGSREGRAGGLCI